MHTLRCLKTLKILHEFPFSSAWKEEVEPAERLTDVFTSCSLLIGPVFGEHYLDKKKCLFIGGVLMKLTDANIRGFFSRKKVPRMEIWRCLWRKWSRRDQSHGPKLSRVITMRFSHMMLYRHGLIQTGFTWAWDARETMANLKMPRKLQELTILTFPLAIVTIAQLIACTPHWFILQDCKVLEKWNVHTWTWTP